MKKVLLFLFTIIINSPNLFSQTNLSTSNITSNNAIVNWENGGCSAGSYILRYRENGAAWNQNSPITITNTGGSQNYNLNNLTSNTTYNWRIKNVDFSTTGNFNLIGEYGETSWTTNNLCINRWKSVFSAET